MAENTARVSAYRIGALGAILTAAGTLASGPLALPVVALVQPQPLWAGAAVFVENFHRIQTVPFYFGFVLLTGSILMLVSICAQSKGRPASLAALVFMSIGGALVFLNYLTQTTFIPAIVDGYTPEFAPVIAAFSMSNPGSLAWAIEMWGYGFMGLGTWLAAGFFGAGRLERAARILFILNGVASVSGALVVSFDLEGVFSIPGLVGYGLWNVLYVALSVVFYLVLRRRRAFAAADEPSSHGSA